MTKIVLLTLSMSVVVWGAQTPPQPATSPPAAEKASGRPSLPEPALATAPPTLIPLPADPHISVDVTFIGTYRTLIGNESKKMSLRAELAQVTVRGQEQKDTFAYVQIPEGSGWGLFYPVNDRFSVKLIVEDDRHRLGAALIRAQRDNQPAEVVGRMKADRQGHTVRGVLPIDPSASAYTITLFAQNGEALARIDARVPHSLKLKLLDVRFGFQPYRPQPDPACPECPGLEVPAEQQGDPRSLQGRPLLLEPTRVQTCITKAFENQTDKPVNVPPPLTLRTVESLRDTTAAWRERMEERLWGEYQSEILDAFYLDYQWLTQMTQDHLVSLNAPPVAPRTHGCVHWDVELTGEVVTVLAVPAERVRYVGDWYSELHHLIREATAKQPLTSASLAHLLNERLSKAPSSEAQRLQEGDIVALGEVWLLRTHQLKSEVHAKPLPRLVPSPPDSKGNS